MKAIVYTQYGPPEVLKPAEVAKPAPKADEILVKVVATTVTVADVRLRGFNIPASYWLIARLTLGFTRPKQAILGAELAGVVEAVGQDVSRFKPGDAVYAAALGNFGAYAEYKCLPEDGPVALKPANLSFEEAAAIPVGARTALHYLRKANLQPGQKILVYGASGSVGSYAVQLARHFGAKVTRSVQQRQSGMGQSPGGRAGDRLHGRGFLRPGRTIRCDLCRGRSELVCRLYAIAQTRRHLSSTSPSRSPIPPCCGLK